MYGILIDTSLVATTFSRPYRTIRTQSNYTWKESTGYLRGDRRVGA